MNVCPLLLGAWTAAGDQSPAPRDPAANSRSGYINVNMEQASRKPKGLNPQRENKSLEPPSNAEPN